MRRHGRQVGGGAAERLALYLAGLPVVAAVDMEIGAHALLTLAKAARSRGVEVIGSFHDFEGTPSLAKLQAVEARGRQMGAGIVKIAATARTEAELARLFALPASAGGAICVLGMGERGGISRVALPCAGSCLAYGSLGPATAPGQLPCRELARELARWGARASG